MEKESYPNFEGKIINGERLPTKADIRKIPDGPTYRNAHPFVKKCCSNCIFLVGYTSWWCRNKAAIKFRGTRRAGVIFCIFWEPDWSEIPKKYKIPEYGYLPTVVKSWIRRLTRMGRKIIKNLKGKQ
jgi:hypothetical protein